MSKVYNNNENPVSPVEINQPDDLYLIWQMYSYIQFFHIKVFFFTCVCLVKLSLSLSVSMPCKHLFYNLHLILGKQHSWSALEYNKDHITQLMKWRRAAFSAGLLAVISNLIMLIDSVYWHFPHISMLTIPSKGGFEVLLWGYTSKPGREYMKRAE